MFVPSKAFRIFLGNSCLILLKNKNFCDHENNSHFNRRMIKYQLFLKKINIKIVHVVLIFQNFWSYRSIRNSQIATDCSVFDRLCFLCVVCLFWWFYGFLWGVFAIEKLEYSRYNARIKYELVCNRTYSSDLFSYTNGSHEGFVEFCGMKFSSFGLYYHGLWNKEWQEPKLGDAQVTPR